MTLIRIALACALRSMDTITIAGARRALYAFDMDSHRDLGAGTTPLARSIDITLLVYYVPTTK